MWDSNTIQWSQKRLLWQRENRNLVCAVWKKTKNSINSRNSWLLLHQEQGCGLQEDFCGFFVSDLPGARCQIARLPNQFGNPARPVHWWWCCNGKGGKQGERSTCSGASQVHLALAQVLEKKGAHAINPILPLSESEERSSAQVFTSIG